MGLIDMPEFVKFTESDSSSKARAAFQWGGTISALFLLVLNRAGHRSYMQTNLIVLYLFISFPNVLFNILRGQFGHWVAFLAVGASLFFPPDFPVARFVLFVVIPNWLSDGLRHGIAGGAFCVITGVLLIITEVLKYQSVMAHQSKLHTFGFTICIISLLYFTVLYLCS